MSQSQIIQNGACNILCCPKDSLIQPDHTLYLRTMEGDMISEVPKDIMGRILERMPIQDAVRTSVLAKNWKYKWASISKLIFGKTFFKYLKHEKLLPLPIYFQTIHNLLLHHEDNVDSFTLYVPDSQTKDHTPVTDLLQLVSERGVKEFTLHYEKLSKKYEEDDYKVLTPLYSCSKLFRLKLIKCGFFRPPGFNGFSNLISLHCDSVNFCNNSFEYIISSCPLIESLILINCSSIVTFDICSTRLKYLSVSVASESMTNINAPNLETLYLNSREDDVDYFGPVRLMTKLHSLKDLCFHLLYFHILDDISLFSSLLYAAPNLEVLDVTTCPEIYDVDAINLLKAKMNRKLEKLETLNVHIWDGSDVEMFLVQRLLSLSPSLKKVQIDPENVNDITVVRNKIMKFPRASPNADITFQESEWDALSDD